MATILLLLGTSPLAPPVFHAVRRAHPDTLAIVEAPVPRVAGLRRRVRQHGPVVALGQVGFRALLARRTRRRAGRIAAIWREAGLSTAPLSQDAVERVVRFDAPDTLARLERAAPQVGVVFATRRLPGAVRRAVGAPILNLHPGVLPAYRGVHTGYWALRRGDPAGFGTSVHLIDEGLDTGPILARRRIEPVPGDDAACYPARLVAAGVPLLLDAIQAVLADRVRSQRPARPTPAPIFLEPTLWSYLAGGVGRGVW